MKTIKYIVISITATIYFGLSSAKLLWWGGLAAVLLSLQMITNAFYLSDKKSILLVGAAYFLFVGSWLMLKNKRK